jgi:hypothetical protein
MRKYQRVLWAKRKERKNDVGLLVYAQRHGVQILEGYA